MFSTGLRDCDPCGSIAPCALLSAALQAPDQASRIAVVRQFALEDQVGACPSVTLHALSVLQLAEVELTHWSSCI